MPLISINNGYQGDIEILIENIRILCIDTEARNYIERCIQNVQIAFKKKLPKLREFQVLFDYKAENKNNIQPLKTKAIVINPKEEPELFDYVDVMLRYPQYKDRRTAEHRDIMESVKTKRA